MSGSVHYSSAFGPSMQAMFRGEQIRVLLQIFNQIPFGLITRPLIKRLDDLKGQTIAVTFGGSTYSVLQALFDRTDGEGGDESAFLDPRQPGGQHRYHYEERQA
jgi:ABC-type nitrate/sulfonate/bicarbonate transport system substrate-binding protein